MWHLFSLCRVCQSCSISIRPKHQKRQALHILADFPKVTPLPRRQHLSEVPKARSLKSPKEVHPKMSAPASVPPPDVSSLEVPPQHCEVGSVCIGRDNNGSIDVHLEKPEPPKRTIGAPAFSKAVTFAANAGPGHKVRILVPLSSEETKVFANQLESLFNNGGWVVSVESAQQPSLFYGGSPGGESWSWVGKGFVCAGYPVSNPFALAALKAVRATGFPCEEKPNDPALGSDFTEMILAVGTREKRSDN